MIQKQIWKDEVRILITDEENLGSVQISIPLYASDIFGKADANFGFLGCASSDIAKHFSKYFGMLITEAKYGDLEDFKIIN